MQINRIRGDTYADSLIVSNDSAGETANLSGCSLLMTLNTVRNPTDNSTQVYQIVGEIVDAEAGIVEFIPTAEQADNVGLFYYDIQMLDAQGIRRTLVKDVYQYIQDITKN